MKYHDCKKSREQLLCEINEVSFAVNDLQLFLNTHPCDEKAFSCFAEMSQKRTALLKEYAGYYGPLTIDTASEDCEASWRWAKQPFPWEQKGVCR